MSLWLQAVIALAVLALAAVLVPLFLQLRRTALAIERSALSASEDLRRVSEDLHATRARLEALADLAQAQVEHPGLVGQVAFGVARALPALLNPPKEGPNLVELLVTGFRTALSLWRGTQAGHREDPHE